MFLIYCALLRAGSSVHARPAPDSTGVSGNPASLTSVQFFVGQWRNFFLPTIQLNTTYFLTSTWVLGVQMTTVAVRN